MLGIGQITTRVAELIRGAMPFAIVSNGTNPDGTARGMSLFERIVSYPSVQAAVDAGTSNGQKWIQIGPGLYKEAVVVAGDDYVIEGAGLSTIIDGTTVGTAMTSAGDYNQFVNLTFRSTAGGGNDYHGFNTTGDYNKITGCHVLNADSDAFVNGAGVWVQFINCSVSTADRDAFASYAQGTAFVACMAQAKNISLLGAGQMLVVGCRALNNYGITTNQSGGLFAGNLTDGTQTLNSNTAAGNYQF